MTHKRFQFRKLVRAHVPRDCTQQGCRVDYRILEEDEHISQLLVKLPEEAIEVATATSRAEQVKELGDVFDVAEALMRKLGISMDEVELARLAKNARKGGFDEGVYIETNDIPVEHPDIPGFLAQPEKYPYLGDVD